MKTETVRQNGFSLTEVLIATGILAVGMAMIAMAFPVGVRLASIATERPVGVVAANEAFAKIRLYSIDNLVDPANPRYALDAGSLSVNACMDMLTLQNTAGMEDCFLETLEPGYAGSFTLIDNTFERFYPSLIPQPVERRYFWSPLLRRTNPNTRDVQITVFICRMFGMGAKYFDMDAYPANRDNDWPVPVKVSVHYPAFGNAVTVNANTQFDVPGQTLTACRFFTEGCMIVEDRTGYLYKVMEMQDITPKDGNAETLVLNTLFPNYGVTGGYGTLGDVDVWVVPPAVGGTRNPCIDVVQMTMELP